MIIKQFNQTSPQTLEANRTQVNINVVPGTKTTVDGDMHGYEYDTIVVENAYMYSDDALVTLAKVNYYKGYLEATDFKMTVDYYATLTPEQQEELIAKREEARAFLKEQGL